jgi:hypothetical protein
VDTDSDICQTTSGSGDISQIGGYQDPGGDLFLEVSSRVDCAARQFSVPGTYRYHTTLSLSDSYDIDIVKD